LRRPDLEEAAPPEADQGVSRRSDEWLWGWHAVVAALANPRRHASRLVATTQQARALHALPCAAPAAEILDPIAISRLLPPGAAHQGLALATSVLEPVGLEILATPASGVMVMLDQVTDPQNVGAIFRSAAAFGARGVILQDRRAPALSGALAKAAAGAVDRIGHARVVNLARALEILETKGWRAVGLDAVAPDNIADALDGSPTVLVMGAEHEGLRRLVREHCDVVARIDMASGFDSLNVAAAAAVALYEAGRRRE
jgi:23S rRNA (guanosine2251-2'-O)-methyltransferase